jgi:hypothetical protein
MHKHSFQYWARRKGLLLKESTVAQLVKQKTKQNSELIKALRVGKDLVSSHINSASEQTAAGVAKWYLYQHERPGSGDPTRDGEQPFGDWLQRSITNHKDYIAAKLDDKGNLTGDLKSRFNDPKFNTEDLHTRVQMWHEDQAAKAEGKGAEGETFIDLSKLGEKWKGWKWVSLGDGYCPIEAKSMGHCGNEGAKPGDDILSLRDPEGYPRLTFIVNDGMLGEMKGRANTKPKKDYHPAIVELLKHDEIKHVVGGGYLPEMNFKLNDLDDETKDELLEDKPDLEVDLGELLEKKIEEINKEHGVSDWKFIGMHTDVDGDEHIYLHMSAWAHTEIKVEWMTTSEIHPQMRVGTTSLSDKQTDAIVDRVNKVIERWRGKGEMPGSDWGEIDIEPKKDSISITLPMDQPQDQYGTNEQNYEEFVSEMKDLEDKKQKFDQDVTEALVRGRLITPPHSVQATRSWDETKFNHFEWDLDGMDVDIRLKQPAVLAEINPPHIQQQYLRRQLIVQRSGSTQFEPPEHPWGIKGATLHNAQPQFRGDHRKTNGAFTPVQNEVEQFKKLILKEIQSMGERQIQIAKKQRILPGMPKPQYQMKFQHDMSIQPSINIKFDERSGNVIIDKFVIDIKHANGEKEVNEAIAFIEFLDKNFDNVMKRMRDLFQQMVVSKMEFEHGDFEKWKQEEEKHKHSLVMR